MTSTLPTHAETSTQGLEGEQPEQAAYDQVQAEPPATGSPPRRPASPLVPLPEIPQTSFGLDIDLSGVFGLPSVGADKVQKRASRVLELTAENERLKAELKALSDKLDAAERRREELARKQRAQATLAEAY